MRQGCLLSQLLFSLVLGIIGNAIRQEKEITVVRFRKEDTKQLWIDDITECTDNPKSLKIHY